MFHLRSCTSRTRHGTPFSFSIGAVHHRDQVRPANKRRRVDVAGGAAMGVHVFHAPGEIARSALCAVHWKCLTCATGAAAAGAAAAGAAAAGAAAAVAGAAVAGAAGAAAGAAAAVAGAAGAAAGAAAAAAAAGVPVRAVEGELAHSADAH